MHHGLYHALFNRQGTHYLVHASHASMHRMLPTQPLAAVAGRAFNARALQGAQCHLCISTRIAGPRLPLTSYSFLMQATTRTVRSRQLNSTVRSELRPGPQAGRGSYPDDPDKAAQLKGVAEKMDAFFANSDRSAFDAVADSNVTLHGDLLILDRDISGSDTVKKTLQTYTDSYDYKHVDVAHGADIDGSSIFHFWLHQVFLEF